MLIQGPMSRVSVWRPAADRYDPLHLAMVTITQFACRPGGKASLTNGHHNQPAPIRQVYLLSWVLSQAGIAAGWCSARSLSPSLGTRNRTIGQPTPAAMGRYPGRYDIPGL
jgi:hypothetical protein